MRLKSENDTHIAIVGMSCRFPGLASSIGGYWQLLSQGQHVLSEVPTSRFDIDTYFDPTTDKPHKTYVKKGAFIDGVSEFDRQFFGISKREAIAMDPQQRILLECTWDALEDSGIVLDDINNVKTGVFIGCIDSEYKNLLEASTSRAEYEPLIPTSASIGAVAGRLSHALGLSGPSMVIDTHYSSSMVALHLACQSLINDQCATAIAAGIHLILSPEGFILFSRNHTLSPDGYSRTFDIDAKGFGRGEGCGVLVLKKLKDAIRDKDRIHSVVLGSAVNHCGRGLSLYSPNQKAQELLLSEALNIANIHPDQISYIEAHGTGTPVGDSTELKAIRKVYTINRNKNTPLYIGSAKTNIGHLEASAGIAGVIKTVLALKHKQIPAHLHFNRLTPGINLDDIPAYIPKTLIQWEPINKRRIAGVSSFGLTGTNAHVIIEEAPSTTANESGRNTHDRSQHILILSANSKKSLENLSKKYIEFLQRESLSDVCYSINNFRKKFQHRIAIVSSDINDAKNKMQKWLDSGEADGVFNSDSVICKDLKIGFLFTGQGAQYVGMGQELYNTNLAFRSALNECEYIISTYNYLDKSLTSLLWGDNASLLNETKYTQPAMFSLEYALYKLWDSLGVIPSAVIGHSLGEYVAACVAGVFSLEDSLKLVSKRAELMQSLPHNGSMLAIETSEEDVRNLIQQVKMQLDIAAINAPKKVVVSGGNAAIKELIRKLTDLEIQTKQLNVSHAFHSNLLDPILNEFESVIDGIIFYNPNIPLISNLTGLMIQNSEITKAKYWIQHTRNTVRFSDGINSMIKMGINCFIEIGPQPVILGIVDECLADSLPKLLLPSLHKSKNDWIQILESLSRLFIHGYNINWNKFDEGYNRSKVDLPSYEFDRQKYWVATKDSICVEDSDKISLNQSIPIQAANPKESFLNTIITASSEKRPFLIEIMLQEEVRNILKMDENIEINVNEDFESIGLDSLLLVEFRNHLKANFNGMLSHIITKSFTSEYNTIASTTSKLVKILNSTEDLKISNQPNPIDTKSYPNIQEPINSYRISSEWIKISTYTEDIPLFGWDLLFMEYQYIPLGYLFEGILDFDLFKTNLLKALNTLPLYAGRVIENKDKKNVISLKNSKGVLIEKYLEINNGAPIAGHVSKKEWERCFEWDAIKKHAIRGNPESPLLAVKIIEFPRTNHTVMCFFYSHLVGDMKTVNMFVKCICEPITEKFDLSRSYKLDTFNSNIQPVSLYQAILETIKYYHYRYLVEKIEIIVPIPQCKELMNIMKDYRHNLKYFELVDLRQIGVVSETYVGNPLDYRDTNLLHVDSLLEELSKTSKLNTFLKRLKWRMVRVGSGGILFDNMIFDEDNNSFPNFGTSHTCTSVKLSDQYDHPNLPIIYQRERGLYIMRVTRNFLNFLNTRGLHFDQIPR